MYQDGMRVLTAKVPRKLIEIIDMLVDAGLYSSRSEFIREALRTLIRIVIERNRDLIKGIIDEKSIQKILKF